MLFPRVIPSLLLGENGLVKTVQFKSPNYVGDPINTIRILNEKEVDELILLDITATTKSTPPPFDIIAQVVSECFMPLTYGGGIKNMNDAKRLFSLGVEKIAINSCALINPQFISELADQFGSQSIVVSIDVKKSFFKKYVVCSHHGKKTWPIDPVSHALHMQKCGAGEILLTAMDREGTFSGFDLPLIQNVRDVIDIPLIAHGGAGCIEDISKAISIGASAVAIGSMVVYQGRNKAVLTNFPERKILEKSLLAIE